MNSLRGGFVVGAACCAGLWWAGGCTSTLRSLNADSQDRPPATLSVVAVDAAPSTAGAAADAPVTAAAQADAADVTLGALVSPDVYRTHIAVLAHDELRGRGTGDYGIDLAAGYVAGQFAATGLLPGGPAGTYFQEYTIPDRSPELLDDTMLAFSGVDRPLKMREDYIPLSFSAAGEFSGEVVFVGYGADNPEKDHNDYAGVEVAGKVLLMLRREPASWGTGGPRGATRHAAFSAKMALATQQKAAAVLVVNPGGDEDILLAFGSRSGGGVERMLPAVHLKREVADALLAAAGAPDLAMLQTTLDGGATASMALPGVTASGKVAFKVEDMLARNVIGVLPGMGPHAEEYVVFGAHYDHLGLQRGSVHNGADDNASGSAGVIEIAKLLAQAPYRDRSVICMTFSGEEMGLLGSRHYARSPTVEIGRIKTMLNMDMIGRLEVGPGNKLAVQGLGTGDSFHELADRHTREMGFEYVPDESAMGPSDHDSFYRAGVPSLFFFTGIHPDYHRPGDDTEKINAAGGARITELVYRIGLDLINVEEPPVYAEVNRPAHIDRSPAGGPPSGVVMGIMPDPDDDESQKGWRIAQVMADGPAASAGLKDADTIVEIEDKPVNGFMDYLAVTREKKPGDVIKVKVQRGDQELTFDVTLSARG